MAGVGDEIGDVGALGQLARMRGCCIQHDNGTAGLELIDEGLGDLADQRVGHRHQDDVGRSQRLALIDAIGANRVLEPLPAHLAHLDMGDVVGLSLQVGGEPHPHLAAGTQQRDLGHYRYSSLSAWPFSTSPKYCNGPICPPLSATSSPSSVSSALDARLMAQAGASSTSASSALTPSAVSA